MPPRVSVVMSVYNGARYLRETIESILSQTFADFEFIIIDDGSTDDSAAIIRGCNDPRIVFMPNEQNIGLTRSLNRGLAAARGVYIARMDADDISLPGRLAAQVAYMDAHPDVGVLGTNVRFIDEDGALIGGGAPMYEDGEPVASGYLKWLLLWQNPLPHPSVMIRKAALEHTGLAYDPAFPASQDYDLWNRLAPYCELALLPEVCLHYRIVGSSITRKHADWQETTYRTVLWREVKRLLGDTIPDRAIQTCFDLLARHEMKASHDFVGAASLIMDSYRHFYPHLLSEREHGLVRAHIMNLLVNIAHQTLRYSPRDTLRVLWQARKMSFYHYILAVMAVVRIQVASAVKGSNDG